MEALISVIIPIYNKQNYLDRCVSSVVNQTYQNIEIILVDDGSFDDSPQICDLWETRDHRISVIHKVNGGVSSARNTGIDRARGTFITFLDGDDIWHSDFLREMITTMRDYAVPIVQCRIKNIDIDKIACVNGRISHHKEKTVLTGKAAILDYNYKVSPCAKLYDISLFQNIRFPEGIYFEDEATYYKLAYLAEKVCMISDELYFYVQTENSITRYDTGTLKMDFIPVCRERIEYFERLGDKDLLQLAYSRFANILILNHATCKKKKIDRQTQNTIISNYRAIYNRIDWEKVSIFYSLLYKGYFAFPDLFANLVRLFRR